MELTTLKKIAQVLEDCQIASQEGDNAALKVRNIASIWYVHCCSQSSLVIDCNFDLVWFIVSVDLWRKRQTSPLRSFIFREENAIHFLSPIYLHLRILLWLRQQLRHSWWERKAAHRFLVIACQSGFLSSALFWKSMYLIAVSSILESFRPALFRSAQFWGWRLAVAFLSPAILLPLSYALFALFALSCSHSSLLAMPLKYTSLAANPASCSSSVYDAAFVFLYRQSFTYLKCTLTSGFTFSALNLAIQSSKLC